MESTSIFNMPLPLLPKRGAKYKLVQPLWRTVWRSLKKLKIEFSYDPAISLLDIYLEKMKVLIRKDTCIPMLLATQLTIAKTWIQPTCPPIDG